MAKVNYFNQLPTWAKGVVAIGVLGLGTIVVYRGYKVVSNLVTRTQDEKDIKNVENEIRKNNLSYSEAEYLGLANRLFVAFDGVGTTEETVKEVILKMKNKDDWNKLVVSYGIKETTSMFSKFSGGLITWLEDEIDSTSTIGKEIYSHLASIGVTI